MVKAITVNGLTANSDGLYRLGDLDNRFAEAMAEYEAITDEVTAVKAPSPLVNDQQTAVYNLQGQRLDTPKPGVIIIGREKKIVKN